MKMNVLCTLFFVLLASTATYGEIVVVDDDYFSLEEGLGSVSGDYQHAGAYGYANGYNPGGYGVALGSAEAYTTEFALCGFSYEVYAWVGLTLHLRSGQTCGAGALGYAYGYRHDHEEPIDTDDPWTGHPTEVELIESDTSGDPDPSLSWCNNQSGLYKDGTQNFSAGLGVYTEYVCSAWAGVAEGSSDSANSHSCVEAYINMYLP